ncbi:WXG100 family type VII secretion target [Nocardia fluminea]|uniref:WXG100 family type VII secretion target n=1 Tax=Nocardia fluminea TaxID=134984 RepID=UPI00343A9E79
MAGNPTEKLAEPTLDDPMNDKFEFIVTSNEISPTYWVCTWCKNVVGTDPVEWLSQKISGDWEALQKAGRSVENLASYSSNFAEEVKNAAAAVDSSWDGNAAAAAQSYFSELSTAIAGQVESLNSIADEISNFANSAYFGAKTLGDGVQSLLDIAAMAAIQWAAAKLAGVTGVGIVATAALVAAATLTTLAAIAEFNLLVQKLSAIYLALEGGAALIYAGIAGVQSGDIPTLPQTSYDHHGA